MAEILSRAWIYEKCVLQHWCPKFVLINITVIHPEKWFYDKLARNCSYHDIVILVFYTSFVYSYRRGTVQGEGKPISLYVNSA